MNAETYLKIKIKYFKSDFHNKLYTILIRKIQISFESTFTKSDFFFQIFALQSPLKCITGIEGFPIVSLPGKLRFKLDCITFDMNEEDSKQSVAL